MDPLSASPLWSSAGKAVVLQQAAESLVALDGPIPDNDLAGDQLVADALVVPFGVVVREVLVQDAPEMAFTEEGSGGPDAPGGAILGGHLKSGQSWRDRMKRSAQ